MYVHRGRLNLQVLPHHGTWRFGTMNLHMVAMADKQPRREWSNALDPWNPCVILGVSLTPTLSEVEDAFAPFAASDHDLVVDKDTQTPEEFERAYERRKKEDAYVHLKCCLRSQETASNEKPGGGHDDDHIDASSECSPTFSPEAILDAAFVSTNIPPSLADSRRFSISSALTTATATMGELGSTTRNSSVQTFKYQSDPEGARPQSRFRLRGPRRRRPKLRGTQSKTGSSSSVGSQFSDASTDGAREALAAISDVLQEHTKALERSENGTAKGQSLLRGVFTSLRRSHPSSEKSDDTISQSLARLVLKFQQVEFALDRSDADPCKYRPPRQAIGFC